MKRSAFFEKTLFLTISNIITGILTFVFSIILSREIGSKGVGIYQLVMPLYNMCLFITSGGITISMSKIAAEKKALGKLNELYKTVFVTCIFELIWSILFTAVLILISKFIAFNIIADERTLYSILAFCPALIIVSISSVYKGVYYGLQKVTEPAVIDIIEKICRITVMYLLVKIVSNMDLGLSAASAVLSLSCGELLSCILFYFCYRKYVKKNPGLGKSDNGFQLVFNVLKLALPLALNGILTTIFSTITAVMIPRRLCSSGITYENALSLFGKLQGMALNVVFFPAIIVNSLNVILIPSISEAVSFKKNYIINHRINIAMRTAAIAGFSTSALLLAIPHEVGQLFFKDSTVGDLIKMLSPGIPLVYIEVISFALLNGLGKQTRLLINSIIISSCDLILLYILLGMPKLNIYGYAINFVISSIVGIFLNYTIILKSCNVNLQLYSAILLPALSSVVVYFINKYLLINIFKPGITIILSYLLFSVLYFPLYKLSKEKK